ncbi:MAG: peptide-binding protein [Candidatus Omnitrophica bacterium]|nr:peptide-binding protein [Candidatus Omnitrophota bacterium]
MNRVRSKASVYLNRLIKTKALLITAVSFLFFSAPPTGAQEAPVYGDAYVSGSISDAITLIPFLATDSTSGNINSMVFNGLTKVDKDLNITGDLAESYDVSDDKLTITFHLRKNVLWQDGVEFTADDVKFTFDLILDPRNAAPYAANFQDIEEIKVVDKYTVQFKYKKPYAPALLKLGTAIMPKHLLKDIDLKNCDFARDPVGTGPYKLKEWKTDQHIILDSFYDYFEGRPFIDKYVERVIPNQAVQFLELITGGIDSMGLTPYQYKYRTDTKKFKERFVKYKYLSRSYTYIGYNLKDPLFKDKKVRQALSYAVDRKAIIDGVLMGMGEECTGPFIKGTYAYNEEVKKYLYSPQKAKELLKEAGWIDRNDDGILEKDGLKFSFKLITNQGNKQREDVATIIQQNWREIGVEVEIQAIAWAAFITEFVDKRNFQALILGWTMPIDPDNYNVWHSDSMKDGGLNFISYRNNEVDSLIEEGRETYNQDERQRIYHKIHEIVAEEQPYTFLYFPYALPAVSKRFKGIEPAPAGISYNFIKWYVPEIEQRYTR